MTFSDFYTELRVTDQAGGLVTTPQTPDLQAKLEGRQSPGAGASS